MYGISPDVHQYFDKMEDQRNKKAQKKALKAYQKLKEAVDYKEMSYISYQLMINGNHRRNRENISE